MALDLVGMHLSAASIWTIKFSYLSFGACCSDISRRISNWFLTVTVYPGALSVLFFSVYTQVDLCQDNSVIKRYSFKRGIYLTVKSAIHSLLIKI